MGGSNEKQREIKVKVNTARLKTIKDGGIEAK